MNTADILILTLQMQPHLERVLQARGRVEDLAQTLLLSCAAMEVVSALPPMLIFGGLRVFPRSSLQLRVNMSSENSFHVLCSFLPHNVRPCFVVCLSRLDRLLDSIFSALFPCPLTRNEYSFTTTLPFLSDCSANSQRLAVAVVLGANGKPEYRANFFQFLRELSASGV